MAVHVGPNWATAGGRITPNRSDGRLVSRTICLGLAAVLVALTVVGCSGSPTTGSPNVGAAGSGAVATGTHTSATGTLTGDLVASGANASVSGAAVILCLEDASGCVVDASLQAISSSSGHFEIDRVPVGSYVIVYSPNGAPGPSVAGLHVDFDGQTASCLGEDFAEKPGYTLPASCNRSIPFVDDGQLTTRGAWTTTLTASVSGSQGNISVTLQSGTLDSPKYGLCLDFENGQALSAVITAADTTNVQITSR